MNLDLSPTLIILGQSEDSAKHTRQTTDPPAKSIDTRDMKYAILEQSPECQTSWIQLKNHSHTLMIYYINGS